MIIAADLSFVPIGAPLSLVGLPTTPSPGVVDLMGSGVGTPPPNIIGNVTLAGSPDAEGVGGPRPELVINVGAAFTTGNAATLTIAMQGAADTGSAGGYLPGTWYTFSQSAAFTAAQLVANQTVMRFPWLPPFPENLRPRYLRLSFIIPGGTAFTAGTIANALVTTLRDDYFIKQQPNNYVVS